VLWVDLEPGDLEADEVIRVPPKDRPIWVSKHWVPKGTQLHGFYRTRFGSFRGVIDRFDTLRPDFYVLNPPPELREHSHWPCFHKRGEGVFCVHFDPAPPNADAGILAIEQVLADALARSRGRKPCITN
jgi:hypothetical protein